MSISFAEGAIIAANGIYIMSSMDHWPSILALANET